MKISVVTAVRNGGDALAQSVQSLCAQTHRDIEHVVQDGGSTDGTLDYLRDHGHPSMALLSQPDTGIYDAINMGISRAQGDIVGLLHADDYLAGPDVLARVTDAFADPDIDGIYGDLEYVSREDANRVIRYWKAGEFAQQRLKRGWMPPHPTLYLRYRVFQKAGLYDTSYRISGDYDSMLRWLTQGRVRLAYIPHVMVRMRIGGTSNKSFAQMLRKSREDYRAIRRHKVGGVGTLVAKNLSKLPQFGARR
ncbi:glycosyltransferase family 2 protein [Yoonia sediminilitoris]|uniref:Glycosyltransferase n=1 Tax=Yoonia sediminilitoris TaxID=1286148 RepID=A0A2T6KB86_9RHOB|nr:glycosyltransferase family 2 protein [Yoonia sediminilitoris]PUB12132.1 glycosyltransferase [Yoonia sediminilitoris]RCW92959.1 glycosyltransferase [Yoonia sediminilitoris]